MVTHALLVHKKCLKTSNQSEGGTPERVMKLAGRMDCQGLLVQAILFRLLSRGWAKRSSAMHYVQENDLSHNIIPKVITFIGFATNILQQNHKIIAKGSLNHPQIFPKSSNNNHKIIPNSSQNHHKIIPTSSQNVFCNSINELVA